MYLVSKKNADSSLVKIGDNILRQWHDVKIYMNWFLMFPFLTITIIIVYTAIITLVERQMSFTFQVEKHIGQ